jgi:hypothetical protein
MANAALHLLDRAGITAQVRLLFYYSIVIES